MKKTLAILNQMEAEKIIQRYAIGGAILESLIIRHGLNDKWESFKRRFLAAD